MTYNYESRTKLAEKLQSAWEKNNEQALNALPKELLALIHSKKNECRVGAYSYHYDSVDKYLAEHRAEIDAEGGSLKDYIYTHFKPIVDIYVPQSMQADFYYILERLSSFSYAQGWYRPTARTAKNSEHFLTAFSVLETFRVFSLYNISIADYLTRKVDPELLDLIDYNYVLFLRDMDCLLMARIEAGDQAVIDAMEEAFLAERNNVLVSTELIRAVVKSKNTYLHELLGKFLLAARLQEGVRQAICENMDCGRPEAFLLLLKVIVEHNLLRFSAIKRAVATWTGIFSETATDRISTKVLSLICEAIEDKQKAMAMTQGEDNVEIIIGLWALGFYEVEEAAKRIATMIHSGNYHQILTASYYLANIHNTQLTNQLAKQVVTQYPDDLKMLTAYRDYYLPYPTKLAHSAAITPDGGVPGGNYAGEICYHPINLAEYYESEAEARLHYGIMQKLVAAIGKKDVEFSPLIFPWHSAKLAKADLLERMAVTAYILQDQAMIDEMAGNIKEMSLYHRQYFVRMLLHSPKTPATQKALIDCLADRDGDAASAAYQLLKRCTLQAQDYMQLEAMLRLKSSATRKNIMELLYMQPEEELDASVRRLLCAKKEPIRLAGLDMVKTLSLQQQGKKQDFYQRMLAETMPDSSKLSSQEKVLFDSIMTKKATQQDISQVAGFGLYDPKATYQPDLPPFDASLAENYFRLSKEEIDDYIQKINDFIDQHGSLEYTTVWGSKEILANGLIAITWDPSLKVEDRFPFPELWQELYNQIIQTPEIFFNLYFAIMKATEKFELEPLLGEVCVAYSIERSKRIAAIESILEIIKSQNQLRLPQSLALSAVAYALNLPEEQRWRERPKSEYSYYNKDDTAFTEIHAFSKLMMEALKFSTDEEFKTVFPALCRLDEVYNHNQNKKIHEVRYRHESNANVLNAFAYVKALQLGIISPDYAYKSLFETHGLGHSLKALGSLSATKIYWHSLEFNYAFYFPEEYQKRSMESHSDFYQRCIEINEALVNLVLDVELKRGDTPTIFSEAVQSIKRVSSIPRLIAILNALGDTTLDRNTYYGYGSYDDKKVTLSHLLAHCYPAPTDTAAELKSAVLKNKISTARLIEVAMYAPQWLDLLEDVLAMPGLKSGCYYFMAHVNEKLSPEKESIVVKYTPLSSEDLENGCFDVQWFNDVYQKLGEKNFALLYKAAKYISDGNKHSRARKYADAARGVVSRDELETLIKDKRNKDLVMSYGLIPMQNEADPLHRYEFLQGFLKESKQFGAQRRASEAKCVEVALKNMASSYGYVDDLRLILAMETELVRAKANYFKGIEIEDYQLKIEVDSEGQASLVISKAGKTLKSQPSALKNKEDFVEIKAFHNKLKEQYRRCVAMFERAMEDEEPYRLGELRKLCQNPVIAGILHNLVYITPDFKTVGRLADFAKQKDNKEICIAHPLTLYRCGKLADYQRYFFEQHQQTGIKQPFKQVYREFYLKLAEENEALDSRMFAGYQIQPQKTVGVLKNRRWVADYENGLQKIFYKANIVATIYAMADWFSPVDTEAPTLEYVSFYDRKNFKPLKLADIPDVLYSEVMRDVDLAVSVAHVGGVDPETSHSTIEMRKVIFAFNFELFGLTNVKMEGTHAYIEGKYGNYSIQLGSGVIHKVGGAMINILPVHSQQRGKIFLPFIDEDPKTAEIMAKILLLAKDDKIKDPYILQQIVK